MIICTAMTFEGILHLICNNASNRRRAPRSPNIVSEIERSGPSIFRIVLVWKRGSKIMQITVSMRILSSILRIPGSANLPFPGCEDDAWKIRQARAGTKILSQNSPNLRKEISSSPVLSPEVALPFPAKWKWVSLSRSLSTLSTVFTAERGTEKCGEAR